jgi:putative methanogenesis marker protein 6
MEQIESRIFVISPRSDLTPSILYRYLIDQKLRLKVKETCFGLIVEGEKSLMKEAFRRLRELDKYNIFSKIRAYPPGDPRICRANRGGGPRLGFHFMEFELEKLPLISSALKSLDERKVAVEKPLKKEPIPIQVIKKLVEKMGR